MKKLLLILLCLPMIGFGQQTYVPDDNFEAYLENHSPNGSLVALGSPSAMGNGIPNDDYVTTTNINTVLNLQVGSQNIADLTGIEDFVDLDLLNCDDNQLITLNVSQNMALEYLSCNLNQLISLDVSQNTNLEHLNCEGNQLTTLDVSGATALTELWCNSNQLTSLDVSNNTALILFDCGWNQLISLDISNNTLLYYLYCGQNQLTTLDLSNNTVLGDFSCDHNSIGALDISQNAVLEVFVCSYNQLTSLDLRNGNNTNLIIPSLGEGLSNNPNLYCISVDDTAFANTYWTFANGVIDSQHYFSNNCSGTSIQEHTTKKELLKVTDLLGRETKPQTNTPFIDIYDDGTVEKRIVIE
jgi:hypothetical protein